MNEHETTIFAAWDQDANLKLSPNSIEEAKKELVNNDGTPSSCHAAQVTFNLPTWTQSDPVLTDESDEDPVDELPDNLIVLPNVAELRIDCYKKQNGALRDSSEIDFYVAWTFWSGDSVEVGISEESAENAVEDLSLQLPDDTALKIEVRVMHVTLVVIKPREMDELVMPTVYVK